MRNSITNDFEKQKGDILQKILAKKGILEDKKIPKLLIIQCSDAKNPNGNISSHMNHHFGKNMSELRSKRNTYYQNLFVSKPNYFDKKDLNKFENAFKSNLKMPAINRYNGRLCNKELAKQLLGKIEKNNLHLLIISGLYGILRYDDEIIDYHLEMRNNDNWYGENIHEAVINYIKENNIPDNCVFYSVGQKNSPSKYHNALNPRRDWTNIWVKGSGSNSLSFSSNIIKDSFLPFL
jgi:hypothetical protein